MGRDGGVRIVMAPADHDNESSSTPYTATNSIAHQYTLTRRRKQVVAIQQTLATKI
jgi:hypothetical protein